MSDHGWKKCLKPGPNGELCDRKKGHPYSDWASNPNKLHSNHGVHWYGATKNNGKVTPPRYPRAASDHYTEADYQTWLRL